ncbi:Cro/CI family transcriptional regulator [Pseudomonas alvandae]|uniref:Cro/CI family transcriptional regulator n=1 Tax=Pseudomonas canavaninivorans TaxID=2842348 RepID=UPI00215F037D|nr:Cro/CI family transcriptional regulator [Pseudomonas canavaninivorans]UVM74907.1 Cro/CI family transcriptional regulator [Pseudomonas canavaninivorans]
MNEQIGTALRVFAEGKTQPELASLLGVSQSAVSQMLSSARDIRVRVDEKGACTAVEIRPIGSRRKPKAA